MNYIDTSIQGVLIVEPRVFSDERGYFFETFREDEFFQKTGVHFVQENESFSQYGVLRGLHFQTNPYAQDKLVRVTSGTVFDVAVDIRKGSPSFGRHVSVELSGENKRQLFIPAGCAHGFIVASRDGARFLYKCSNYYNKESEGGIRFDDPALGIDWIVPREEMSVADKDLAWPYMSL